MVARAPFLCFVEGTCGHAVGNVLRGKLIVELRPRLCRCLADGFERGDVTAVVATPTRNDAAESERSRALGLERICRPRSTSSNR